MIEVDGTELYNHANLKLKSRIGELLMDPLKIFLMITMGNHVESDSCSLGNLKTCCVVLSSRASTIISANSQLIIETLNKLIVQARNVANSNLSCFSPQETNRSGHESPDPMRNGLNPASFDRIERGAN